MCTKGSVKSQVSPALVHLCTALGLSSVVINGICMKVVLTLHDYSYQVSSNYYTQYSSHINALQVTITVRTQVCLILVEIKWTVVQSVYCLILLFLFQMVDLVHHLTDNNSEWVIGLPKSSRKHLHPHRVSTADMMGDCGVGNVDVSLHVLYALRIESAGHCLNY